MEIRKLIDEVSVAAQIRPEEVAEIARLGFRSIICNRPDGEGFGQPAYGAIQAAAEAAGLETRYIPVRPGAVSGDAVRAFAEAIATLPRPVLAYCRSGARSVTLWSLAKALNRSAAEVIDAESDPARLPSGART